VSEFDGLNLPQLLDRMHDLAVPEPVSWLPQTDGWWILLIWLVLLAGIGIAGLVGWRRRNRYRREALSELASIVEFGGPGGAAAVAELIKRTALTVFPRTEVAALYGEKWSAFLVRTGGNDEEINAVASHIARASYAPDVEVEEIIRGAERWIRRHRV
jgi:LPXTG-motif cell wall-anchored protein